LCKAGLALDPALLVEAQSTEQAGFEAMSQLLARGTGFDALFTASDLIAMGAISALRERGRSVPGDVAVVGFVDNLLKLTAGEEAESTLIEPQLIVRASCGNAPR